MYCPSRSCVSCRVASSTGLSGCRTGVTSPAWASTRETSGETNKAGYGAAEATHTHTAHAMHAIHKRVRSPSSLAFGLHLRGCKCGTRSSARRALIHPVAGVSNYWSTQGTLLWYIVVANMVGVFNEGTKSSVLVLKNTGNISGALTLCGLSGLSTRRRLPGMRSHAERGRGGACPAH